MLAGFTTDAPSYRERWIARANARGTRRSIASSASRSNRRRSRRARSSAWSTRLRAPRTSSCAAAGSLPGDLHKLWRAREPNTYHLEYGYSCMGYEIAGGLGVKMADPSREVYVMVGDGSYLMMAQEIVTSVQEGYKLIVVLLDSQGYASIGGLSRSIGSRASARSIRRCRWIWRPMRNRSARSCTARRVESSCSEALAQRPRRRTHHGDSRADRPDIGVPGYEIVVGRAVAEVSEQPDVQRARAAWEQGKQRTAAWSIS